MLEKAACAGFSSVQSKTVKSVYSRSESVSKEMMKHKELTSQIIKCAYAVHQKLGFGFLVLPPVKNFLVLAGLRMDRRREWT